MTEEYKELLQKLEELEQAKKEIEELKNSKEILKGYLKPNGTIKIIVIIK